MVSLSGLFERSKAGLIGAMVGAGTGSAGIPVEAAGATGVADGAAADGLVSSSFIFWDKARRAAACAAVS